MVNSIYCANPLGKLQHTKLYNEYKKESFPYNDFYMPKSFGNDIISINECKKYTTRKEFIQTLTKNGINCSGKWCYNGQYKYISSSISYEVEHIIDNNHAELDGCSKNIYGNIILAYGTWNRQIGQLKWINAKNEKIEIYGKSIVETALLNIKKCDVNCRTINNSNNDIKKDVYIGVGINDFIILIVIIIVAATLTLCFQNDCKPKETKFF
jgi:hypothetical protein